MIDDDEASSSCDGGVKKKIRKGAGRPRKEPDIKKERGSSVSEDEIVHSARATNSSGKK